MAIEVEQYKNLIRSMLMVIEAQSKASDACMKILSSVTPMFHGQDRARIERLVETQNYNKALLSQCQKSCEKILELE